ncbi:hypothetical protein STEG23_024642 [Scotinomys teguina]
MLLQTNNRVQARQREDADYGKQVFRESSRDSVVVEPSFISEAFSSERGGLPLSKVNCDLKVPMENVTREQLSLKIHCRGPPSCHIIPRECVPCKRTMKVEEHQVERSYEGSQMSDAAFGRVIKTDHKVS